MKPDVIDEWWEATRERRLLVQRCTACGRCQHYPRALCAGCGADDALTWIEASGQGHVWSFTTVHRAPGPEIAVPYTVALVRLEEGAVMLTALEHADSRCDEPVSLHWRPLADGRNLPIFGRA